LKENASNVGLLNGALNSIAELKAEMAAMKSEHAAEMAAKFAAMESEMKSKDAKQDAIIASLKAHRHGVVPSNLRRRTEEMSMSMPATANIWHSGGDEEPKENFFYWSDWFEHQESCCDDVKELEGRVSKLEDEGDVTDLEGRVSKLEDEADNDVTDLEGRVSKLEDEVDSVTTCVKFEELYMIDEGGPSLPTCKIGLGVSQVAIEGNDRVATSTTGRVTVVTQDFDVDAQDSVTVKATKTATVEAHDIVLKSKNDIMAHAGNNTVIKADTDVHITADASSDSVGDVKIAGENVHVDAEASVDVSAKKHVMVKAVHNVTVMADDTVTVEANDDIKIAGQDVYVDAEASVIIDADANGNTEGNVIIEGVKYFPQKKEICWSDQTKEISLRLDPPPVIEDSTDWTPIDSEAYDQWYSISDNKTFIGSFDFGKISVGNGPGDVVVDVVASTGGIYFAGNDYYFESNLTETLGNNTEDFDQEYPYYHVWSYVEGAQVALAVELEPVGGPAIKPVPQAKVTLSSFQDVFNVHEDDDYSPDAMFWQKNQTATHPAKYLFPDTEEGEYEIKVRIYLEAESELQTNDEMKLTSELKVKLGPHFISAAVIDADHAECAAPSQA